MKKPYMTATEANEIVCDLENVKKASQFELALLAIIRDLQVRFILHCKGEGEGKGE